MFRINDDEYMDEIWQVGILGLLAYLTMILAPIVISRRAIRGRDPTVSQLALAGSAGCVAYLVANALFDAMSFPQAPYMFFIVAALTTVAAAGPEGNVVPTREEIRRALPAARSAGGTGALVRRRRVLVHAAGELGDCLAGPEIRALEFAKALSSEYDVTLAAVRSRSGERDGIPVVPSSRRSLLREARGHDAVLSACLPPYLLAMRALLHGPLTIADLYDPHEQELATLEDGRERTRALQARAAIQALHLRHADVVLCASEPQREELRRSARALRSPTSGRLAVLPFGLPDPPAPTGRRPLHERFPQLCDGDTVVLWWGTPWRWLDAETPIRALARIAGSRPDLKLVITAGKPRTPRPSAATTSPRRCAPWPASSVCSTAPCCSSTTGSPTTSASTSCARPTSA